MITENCVQEGMGTLKANYGKTSVERIREVLQNSKPVVLGDNGIGSMHGYYCLSPEKMAEVLAKPRNISYSFDPGPLGEYVPDLELHREMEFYVKSSSRFFLKPDIGEVIDQMTDEDVQETDAIYIVQGSHEIANHEGDEFVMTARLLRQMVR